MTSKKRSARPPGSTTRRSRPVSALALAYSIPNPVTPTLEQARELLLLPAGTPWPLAGEPTPFVGEMADLLCCVAESFAAKELTLEQGLALVRVLASQPYMDDPGTLPDFPDRRRASFPRSSAGSRLIVMLGTAAEIMLGARVRDGHRKKYSTAFRRIAVALVDAHLQGCRVLGESADERVSAKRTVRMLAGLGLTKEELTPETLMSWGRKQRRLEGAARPRGRPQLEK